VFSLFFFTFEVVLMGLVGAVMLVGHIMRSMRCTALYVGGDDTNDMPVGILSIIWRIYYWWGRSS
jgi:hypothetical protein